MADLMVRDLATKRVDALLDRSGANARHSAATPDNPTAVLAYNRPYEQRRLQYIDRAMIAITHALETVEAAINQELA